MVTVTGGLLHWFRVPDRICACPPNGALGRLFKSGLCFVVDQFQTYNVFHFIHNMFLFHVRAPELYKLIGSRGFLAFLVLCHATCALFDLTLREWLNFQAARCCPLSAINLSVHILLFYYKHGPSVLISSEFLSELVRAAALDTLLLLDQAALLIVPVALLASIAFLQVY